MAAGYVILPATQSTSERHHHSHRTLLRRPNTGENRQVDAVVVAAARPVEHLVTSADLAESLGAVLVVLSSKQARPSGVAELSANRPGLRSVAVDIPTGYHHRLLSFATARCDEVKVVRLGDLSVKRNLGVLLGRSLGWQSMLFLDDDITQVGPAAVRRAAATLDRNVSAVGLPVTDYPDNSVVCHANRLAGGRQDVFVSGSALLVDPGRTASFFPEVYNEDWLFLCDSLQTGHVGVGDPVRQLEYQPFSCPDRATAEEFGDVLAEGLVGLLHRGRSLAQAEGAEYWRRFLTCRAEFIEGVALRLNDCTSTEEHKAALRSLAAAQERCSELAPASLAAYYRTWRTDQMVWSERLADRKPAESIGKELADLGLQSLISDARPAENQREEPILIDQCHTGALPMRIAATAQLHAPGRRLQQGEWDGITGPTDVGPGCDIGHFCVVGQGTTLGAGTTLDSYCLVEGGVTIGENVLLTHRASVGCRAIIGDDSVIGALVCDGSTVGRDCRVFGDLIHRQLDPSLAWDAPEAQENAPILEAGVFIGWGATVVGGVTIGTGAYVCAGAIVTRNVPAGWIVTGLNQMRRPERWPGALGRSPFFRLGAQARRRLRLPGSAHRRASVDVPQELLRTVRRRTAKEAWLRRTRQASRASTIEPTATVASGADRTRAEVAA